MKHMGNTETTGGTSVMPSGDQRPRSSRQAASGCHGRRGLSRTNLAVVLAAICLVAVPVLVRELPRERARWHAAAASELQLDQRYQEAIAEMDRAIELNEAEAAYYLQRAHYKLMTDQWESGLADCDLARQLAPQDVAIDIAITTIRVELLLHLKRYERAIAELKELMDVQSDLSPPQRAQLLNHLAYARAVGKRELTEGLAAVDEALEIVSSRVSVLDPRGYLEFHRAATLIQQGEKQQAIEALDKAERSARPRFEQNARRMAALAPLPRRRTEYVDRSRALRSHLAGILALRARLHEELEQPELAQRDRQSLKALAPEGNIAIAEPLDVELAIEHLQATSSMLDTRGYLHYQLGDLPAAAIDLQQALEMIETVRELFPEYLRTVRYRVADMRPFELSRLDLDHILAVMYYHRLLILEAQGQTDAAEQDRSRIHELGFEPNEQLF
jgi:tetratricopeptide (TPR) repeat protein